MLKTKSVQFAYSPSATFQFPDIECPAGDTLLITGASGKGKTTLLHLLAGILKPTAGEIIIDKTDITGLSDTRLDKFRGKKIGIVFQQSHFVQSLTVLENILLAAYFSRSELSMERANELLERLNMSAQANKNTAKLSQGQQQRVSIARAVMNRPCVILADEPTSSLDDEHCIKVAELLQQQAIISNAALIIVTHDQRLKKIFQRTIQLT